MLWFEVDKEEKNKEDSAQRGIEILLDLAQPCLIHFRTEVSTVFLLKFFFDLFIDKVIKSAVAAKKARNIVLEC